jgi:type IV pilus assembly protein PilB
MHCQDTGYKGRIGIYEVLTIDETIQDMVGKQAPAHEITRAARAAGRLRLLREDAAEKVCSGVTTFEEAASAVMT